MGIIKNFIDELAKHKFLVYFVTLWGALLFLWNLYALIEWGGVPSGIVILDGISHLSLLLAGLILTLFGIKLSNTTFLEGIKNDKLLSYFLLVWAVSFLFLGLFLIADRGPYIFEDFEILLAFLAGLAAIFAGITLGLFSWNQLKEPE